MSSCATAPRCACARRARDDEARVLAFLEHLSDESLYLRFHGVADARRRGWSSRCSTRTGSSAARWSGASPTDGGERIVALASYVAAARPGPPPRSRSPWPTSCRARASARGCSSSSRTRARQVGIGGFVAEVLPDNRAMLRVFEDAGFEVERELEGGVDRGPLRDRADRRLPRARRRARPRRRRGVAARRSSRPRRRRRGRRLGAARLDRRRAVPQHPGRRLRGRRATRSTRTAEPVAGVRAYASIAESRTRSTSRSSPCPPSACIDAAEAALRAGVRALCVISAGFAETGAEGAERQDALLALVRSHGARLIGPNCLGVAVVGGAAQRDVRAAGIPAGQHRLLVAERRARARVPRGGGRARPRALGVRLDRQQGGRLLQRPARVLGGRRRAPTLVLLYLESFGNPRRFGAHRPARRAAASRSWR